MNFQPNPHAENPEMAKPLTGRRAAGNQAKNMLEFVAHNSKKATKKKAAMNNEACYASYIKLSHAFHIEMMVARRCQLLN